MKEQIEEMATVISNYFDGFVTEADIDILALTLYEKGYRKQSEVAREIFNDLKANQIPCVSEDGAVFFCIKSKTFKRLKKKYLI